MSCQNLSIFDVFHAVAVVTSTDSGEPSHGECLIGVVWYLCLCREFLKLPADQRSSKLDHFPKEYLSYLLKVSLLEPQGVCDFVCCCFNKQLSVYSNLQLVELKNGETYNGHLVSCDNWMNINLREVICTSRVRVVASVDKQFSEGFVRCWCCICRIYRP